ncbi:MAG: InlB B-repeat-containing protein [Bacillota bacterium]|nr:InlB B-repeat-containing protein [Bacillota bacterium]
MGGAKNTGDNSVDESDSDDIEETLINEEVLSIRGWSCPEYTEDEEGNLPYSGSFFFQALLGQEGEEEEYVFSEGTEPVGVWVIFDAPMLLGAVTATPGIITSDQEWGEQTLTAGTYTINPGVTVTVSGKLTVSGNVTIKGGGKLVRAGSYVGSSSYNGSYSTMIYVSGGSLTLQDITIDGNQVNACGPAVYMESGTVTMNSGAVIQNNYNMNTSTSAGTYAAGGIYCGENATLNIAGGTIQNCKTLGGTGSSAYNYAGGGIYLKGTCNMSSGSILNNYASNGGGIYLASGAILNLTGGTISGNSVSGEGSGIYYSTVYNTNGKLSVGGNANISDIIYLDITSGTTYPLITSKLNYKITLKCNSTDAGKVLAKGGSNYTLTSVDASKISMANTGLYSVLDKDHNQIILSTTEEPEAEWQESAGGGWKRGKFTTALANVYSGGTIKLLTDIVFTEKVEITKTVTITSAASANPNTITRMPSGEYGNITLTGSGSLTLTNIIYDGNRDYISGGAEGQSLIKIGSTGDTGASLTLGSGCKILNGYKSGGSGVIAVYGTMTMNQGAVIENCEVTGTGGAVWVSSSGTFNMNGGTIQSCRAGAGGSAVSTDGTCNLNGGSITGNTDTSLDCAVYLRPSGSGSLTLKGVSISGNTYSVYNDGKSVTVAGDSILSGSIYTTNAISASGSGVSSLTKTHTILMSSVTNGDTVVTGSTDNAHYKLDSTEYALNPANGNLIAAAAIYTVTYNKNSGAIANESNYTSYTYGTGLTLPTPTRAGYTFGGWYINSSFTGSAVTKILTTDTGNKIYYAKWKDETAPDAPVLQSGVTLPADWTSTQKTIPLTLNDGVGVTEVYVSIDNGAYTKISGFTSGSGQYSYVVMEGAHSYQFYARDAAGNESAKSAVFTVKLDTTKPVIGELTYENEVTNLLNWIIGKKSLIIYVPVVDEGSGVTQISYTMTPVDAGGSPDGSKAETKTASVSENGGVTEAKITFEEEFKGNITITCSDVLGNPADSVTISVDGGGIIVENNAPKISFAVNGGAVSENYYDAAPDILVRVADDKDDMSSSVITGGIKSVTYQIGSGTAKSDHNDYSSGIVENSTFTISANEIPTGETEIIVTATDNAGNTAIERITVKVKSPEEAPNAVINYMDETLTGLVANAEYEINGSQKTADENGVIPIESSWIGTTISIVKNGNDSTTLDSAAQSLSIPARPEAPTPELASCTDTSITLQTIANVQYRIENGEWQSDTTFSGLMPKTKYTFEAYYLATASSFRSLSGNAVFATRLNAPAEDSTGSLVIIDYEKETFIISDQVEAFKDAACTQPIVSNEDHDVTDYIGGIIYIRYPADGDFPESGVTAIPVKSRPAVPTVGYTDETYPGAGDGIITGLTAGTVYEISGDGGSTWTDAVLSGTEINGLAPGSYQVRVKAGEENFQSEASGTIIIGTTPPTEETTPQAGISYENGALTGLTPGEKYEVSYTAEDGATYTQEHTADENGTIEFEEEWYGQTLEIVKSGNGKDKTDSKPQKLTVPARPQEDFTGISAAGETGKNKDNGRITGLTPGETYEISADGGNTWQEVTVSDDGQIKNLAPGSYEIRTKATGDTFASESVKVTVPAYSSKSEGNGSGDGKDYGGNNVGAGDDSGKEENPVTGNNTGKILKEVENSEKAPGTQFAMTTDELAAVVLTDGEIRSAEKGTDIKILLIVEDAADSISSQDKRVIDNAKGSFEVGQYLDISLLKIIGGSSERIAETDGMIRITISVPDELKNTSSTVTRDFAVIRVHNGEAVILNDLDTDEDTVTFETNLFSAYALLYCDVSGNGGVNNSESTKDNEPKTGDNTSSAPYATAAMIAGLAYLRLYFGECKGGMTEEEKKELVAKIIRWARRGGKLRRILALAAIIPILMYYHSIGKKTTVEWNEVYGA